MRPSTMPMSSGCGPCARIDDGAVADQAIKGACEAPAGVVGEECRRARERRRRGVERRLGTRGRAEPAEQGLELGTLEAHADQNEARARSASGQSPQAARVDHRTARRARTTGAPPTLTMPLQRSSARP